MLDPGQTQNQSKSLRRAWTICGVTCLLLVLFLQLAFSVRQESISWDEGDHLFSGYMMWKQHDYGLNPEHPPLVKLVAALPLLPMRLRVPALQHRQFKIEAFLDGRNFAAWNYSKNILFRARMAVSVFAFLLALFIFFAARAMFGAAAGFIALALFVFDPNFLAHGALIGTDVGVSCFLFASVYCFYRYIQNPSILRLVIAGGVTGLAFASKHTGILLLPILLALVIFESLRRDNRAHWSRSFARLAGSFVVTAGIGFLVLWASYGFRYSARPAGLSMNPPLATYAQRHDTRFETRALAAVAHLHLLPESYLYGMADIQFADDIYTAYFFGHIYPHGIWQYFPGVLAIKSTLPFLLLMAAACLLMATGRLRRSREILFLAVPPAIYLAVSMSSHMNIGARHILPVYPFLYVLAAGAASALIRWDRRWIYAIAVLLCWQAFEAIHAFPAYIAYANEAWGGPANTHKYLSDSNVDWGQQLIAVRRYLDQHRIKQCWFVYFAAGVADPTPYGIPCHFLPTADTLWWLNQPLEAPPSIDGTVLVSASDLAGFEFGPAPLNPYEQFQTMKPVAVIQHGVYVYQGHFEIPLAAAFSRDQEARNLLDAKQAAAALPLAQQAFALAPDAVVPNAVLGDTLTALGRTAEARPHYEKALALARSVQPAFQQGWASAMEANLAPSSNAPIAGAH